MWNSGRYRSPYAEAPPRSIMTTPVFSMPVPSVPNGALPQPFQPLGLPSPPTNPSTSPSPHYHPSRPPSSVPAPPSSLPPAPGTDPASFPGGFGARDARPHSSAYEPQRASHPTRLHRPQPSPPAAGSSRPLKQYASAQNLRPSSAQQQASPRPVRPHASQANLRPTSAQGSSRPAKLHHSSAVTQTQTHARPSAEGHQHRPRPPAEVSQSRPQTGKDESKAHKITAVLGHKIGSASTPHLPLSGQSQQPQQHQAASRPPRPTPAPMHVRMSAEDEGVTYSACTGRKKALCIGINYTGTSRELYGCVNDARNVRKWLIKNHNFKAEDIVLLVDGPGAKERALPTRAHILAGMRWLVRNACPDDSLFFHYSGHGAQARDKDGDEIDGFDEVIFPLDYKKAGYIVDDDMHALMVRPLPRGCRLTALFDSCHSASALDLPYLYESDGRLKRLQVTKEAMPLRKSNADAISFAACKDSQTSADTYENGEAVGAMSYAFMLALSQNPSHSYQGLLKAVRKILRDKYSQKPQLSASHPINTALKFVL